MIKDVHYSLDIEKAVLGVCLIENAFGRTYGVINSDHFYHDGYKQVFEVMKEMYELGLPVDMLTVIDQLVRVKRIQTITGDNIPYFITRLTQDVVSSAHLEFHCHLLRSMWMEREVIKLTTSGTIEGDVRQKLADLQSKISSINKQATSHDWETMDSLMVKLYQHQDDIRQNKGMGLATGLKTIDKENGGFHPGQMIVLGARPSVGKSAFIGQVALDIARAGKRVGIISLEMSNTEIAARLAAIDTNTDFSVLYRGLYKDEREAEALYQKISSQTINLPISVSEKTNVNIHDIRAKAEKLKAKDGLDILMIDYLQLIESNTTNKNREYEVAQISRGCKIMAKEMNIPVVVLCQLNRQSVHRKGDDRYPQLSDLRESGAIEQDADVVLFLHRDWMNGTMNNENGQSTEFEADLICRKWRNGKNNWMIKLDFDPPKMKFTEQRQNFIKVQMPQDNHFNDDNPF
jgi:replicative DNA helicase